MIFNSLKILSRTQNYGYSKNIKTNYQFKDIFDWDINVKMSLTVNNYDSALFV